MLLIDFNSIILWVFSQRKSEKLCAQAANMKNSRNGQKQFIIRIKKNDLFQSQMSSFTLILNSFWVCLINYGQSFLSSETYEGILPYDLLLHELLSPEAELRPWLDSFHQIRFAHHLQEFGRTRHFGYGIVVVRHLWELCLCR